MPLTIFWIILLTGIVLYFLKRKRTGLGLVFFSVLWLAIISTPFLPHLLVSSLEKRFPPLLELPKLPANDTVYILVLGGGHMENVNLPPNDQLSLSSVSRLLEGIRLHRLSPGSRMVFSGIAKNYNYSHATVMRQSALSMGVEEEKISLLPTSVNTQAEAIDYAKKFGTGNTLILVTDAIHMPRAMFLFQKAGQSPIPAPTNHLVKSNRRMRLEDWGPSSENIAMMEYAMHEMLGMVWAKL
jgi:uncharacterized SAM-binding protein YcdF (DUF218 family)